MTVIIGYTNKSGGYIASDSQCSSGNEIISKHQNKIVVFNTNVGIAISGLCRVQTIVQNKLKFSSNKHNDDESYICEICDKLRDINVKELDMDDNDSFNILVVYNKKIYSIDKSYSIVLIQESFYSEGCGASYALGAMYAVETRCDFKNRNTEEYARYIINAGLDAAIEYSSGCGGDKKIIKIG